MIAIIDYGMGNVRSLLNAIQYLGHDAVITSDRPAIDNADKIILPGVGAFGDAIKAIRLAQLDEILYGQVFEKGKPMLGICLGLQLLAQSSEEHGFHTGLAWLDATVVKFNSQSGVKLPHIGWNDIMIKRPHPIFTGLRQEERSFYFVHSYHMKCRNTEDILATCMNGIEFTAAICHENIIATQFHPEKSQDNGIQILTNFLKWNP